MDSLVSADHSMNPWTALAQEAPFVLADDRDDVLRFNTAAGEKVRLELELLPEPWVGSLGAPIVLLALNPGVSAEDFTLHRTSEFRNRVIACHCQQKTEWPYYYLDPDVEGPGARWSRRILGPLIRECGLAAVARGVVLLEYLPYHSRHFAHRRLALPSQTFSFELVRASLAKASAIFVTRGIKVWTEAVPSLIQNPKLFRTRSVQNISISQNNCPDGWAAAVAAIRAAG